MITHNKGIHLLALVAFGLLVAAGGKTASLSSPAITQAPVEGERKAEINIARGLPVSVISVKNLQNEEWLKDLEIEVENISNRLIYSMEVDLNFPDIPKTTEVDGIPRGYGFTLRYGRLDLIQSRSFATSEDIPIRPREKYIFKIPEPYWKGIKSHLVKRDLPELIIKRIRIKISTLSFGDGTGFIDGAVLPVKQVSRTHSV